MEAVASENKEQGIRKASKPITLNILANYHKMEKELEVINDNNIDSDDIEDDGQVFYIDMDLSDSSDDTSSEVEEGYYVEILLSFTDDNDEWETIPVIFNFGTEETYTEYMEDESEELEEHIADSAQKLFPDWSYENEWEIVEEHGDSLPDDTDLTIVDIE
jgi:hypothetical protein